MTDYTSTVTRDVDDKSSNIMHKLSQSVAIAAFMWTI
jgi:hypothetical protein